MNENRKSRRSFLVLMSTVATTTGMLLAGCDGGAPKEDLQKIDPAEKAKDSMDFYKNNQLKKGGAKK